MSRITAVTLLLIILVVSFYHSTAQSVGGRESSLKDCAALQLLTEWKRLQEQKAIFEGRVIEEDQKIADERKRLEEQKAIFERRVIEEDQKIADVHTSSHRPKLPIHECGCTVHPNGKLWCQKQQKQYSSYQTRDLGRCLCSKPDHHKFKTACERFRKFIEPQLSYIPSTPL